MAEMLGRTESSVKSIVEMYKLPRHPWYYTGWKKVPPDIKQEILDRMEGWIETEKLTAQRMCERIHALYNIRLNQATVGKWVYLLPKHIIIAHKRNNRDRKSRNATLQHRRARLRGKNE